jgi:hypothetical protein
VARTLRAHRKSTEDPQKTHRKSQQKDRGGTDLSVKDASSPGIPSQGAGGFHQAGVVGPGTGRDRPQCESGPDRVCDGQGVLEWVPSYGVAQVWA